MYNNAKYSKVLSYADINIRSIKPANIVIIDMYASTSGGHHAGNCNEASSAGHVEKNQRYGVNIMVNGYYVTPSTLGYQPVILLRLAVT